MSPTTQIKLSKRIVYSLYNNLGIQFHLNYFLTVPSPKKIRYTTAPNSHR